MTLFAFSQTTLSFALSNMRDIFRPKELPGEEAPKEIYGWRPYVLSFSAAWASAMYGYDSAFIGGTLSLPSFERTFHLDTASAAEKANLSSNIVSTFQGGAFFGSAFGFFLAERFGRKPVILLSAAVFCAGVACQLAGQLSALYAGRVLTGLGVGASAMILPIYIAECSPAAIRGRLVGLFEVMLQVALVFGFWVNYGVNKNISPDTRKQWVIPVAVQFIPAGLLVMSMAFMIESPRWLVSKNRIQAATKALSWVRNLSPDHPYLQREIGIMEGAVTHELEETGGSRNWVQIFRELGRKGVRNRLFISCGLMIFQNMTG